MKKYDLDFLEVEDQRKCFAALFENQARENHEQTTADFLSSVGSHVDAFGPGRVPVFTYVGNNGWLVNLVKTDVGADNRRVVERCFVFSEPKYPEVAKRLEQLVRHAVTDVLNSVGEQREQNHRKLRHIASTVDPILTTMFSCKTSFATQMQLLDRIEDRANRASVDKTVAQYSTLLYLTKLLHFIRERGTRLGKRSA